MLDIMKFIPDTLRQYPLFMFIYWIVIWGIFFLVSTIDMLPNISKNGYVVRKDVCLETVPAGRFDESTQCVEYGNSYYVPVGEELINNFKRIGIGSFIFVLLTGIVLMNGKRIEVKEKDFD